MEKFPHADLDFKLWWLIHYLRHTMYRARKKELAKYEISPEQAATLFIVKILGPVKTSEISKWILRKPHTVSSMIMGLENKGLVIRIYDLHRRNIFRIQLTERGRQTYRKIMKRDSTIHRIMSPLSREESAQLKLYLEKLWGKALEVLANDAETPFLKF